MIRRLTWAEVGAFAVASFFRTFIIWEAYKDDFVVESVPDEVTKPDHFLSLLHHWLLLLLLWLLRRLGKGVEKLLFYHFVH